MEGEGEYKAEFNGWRMCIDYNASNTARSLVRARYTDWDEFWRWKLKHLHSKMNDRFLSKEKKGEAGP